jgi:site-specific recombinase
MFLASAVRASGFSPALRQRMSPELLVERPFRQLARVAEQVREHAISGDTAALLREAQYLRALLDTCRRCADSVHEHLEEHGVSVDVVFEVDQLRERTQRIDALLICVVSPEPAREVAKPRGRSGAHRRRAAQHARAVRAALLAARAQGGRAQRRDRRALHHPRPFRVPAMLHAAAGGGAVLAGTTFMKFFVLAIGLSAFWAGFWAGVNYAGSFVLIHLLHFTVATKQPAMTAPAMADKLADVGSDEAVEGFVDEVANLIRSQAAGIVGNLAAVAPLVLAVQLGCQAIFGAPLVGPKDGAARAGERSRCSARRCCSRPSPACCCSRARSSPAGSRTGSSGTASTARSPGTRASSPAWARPARSAGPSTGAPTSRASRPTSRSA